MKLLSFINDPQTSILAFCELLHILIYATNYIIANIFFVRFMIMTFKMSFVISNDSKSGNTFFAPVSMVW